MNIIENKAFYFLTVLFVAMAILVVIVYGPARLSKACDLPIDKESNGRSCNTHATINISTEYYNYQ